MTEQHFDHKAEGLELQKYGQMTAGAFNPIATVTIEEQTYPFGHFLPGPTGLESDPQR